MRYTDLFQLSLREFLIHQYERQIPATPFLFALLVAGFVALWFRGRAKKPLTMIAVICLGLFFWNMLSPFVSYAISAYRYELPVLMMIYEAQTTNQIAWSIVLILCTRAMMWERGISRPSTLESIPMDKAD